MNRLTLSLPARFPTRNAFIPIRFPGHIDIGKYNAVMKHLRTFFDRQGFLESCTGTRRSVLAGCESSDTVVPYSIAGQTYPLHQSGQLLLEFDLLQNPSLKQLYCTTHSYRDEPNPKPGRHEHVFSLFEIESVGSLCNLIDIESSLVHSLGFRPIPVHTGAKGIDKTPHGYPILDYAETAASLGTKEIESEHELELSKKYGPVVFLYKFPTYTQPFWGMKRSACGQFAEKIDVLLEGVETIGSAERSTDPIEMRRAFYQLNEGKFAKHLHHKFGKDRVDTELNQFLSLKMIPRMGFGCGVNRLIRAIDVYHNGVL